MAFQYFDFGRSLWRQISCFPSIVIFHQYRLLKFKFNTSYHINVRLCCSKPALKLLQCKLPETDVRFLFWNEAKPWHIHCLIIVHMFISYGFNLQTKCAITFNVTSGTCSLVILNYWVLCCDVRYDCRIKTMFSSSLPPVMSRRTHVLFTLIVVACAKWCPTHIVLFGFCFVFQRLVYRMTPVSLNCPFLIIFILYFLLYRDI